MTKTIAAVVILLASLAASAPGAIGAEPGPGPSSYTLTLSAQDIAYIAAVLRERPYKDVAQILAAMQSQVDAQRVEAAAAAADKPKD